MEETSAQRVVHISVNTDLHRCPVNFPPYKGTEVVRGGGGDGRTVNV